MLNYISNFFKRINNYLADADHGYQRDLEKFLLTKNLENAADADLWIRIYNRDLIGRSTWM